MLRTLFALLVLILIAYIGSRHGFQKKILSRGLYHFFLTGTEYIFIGLLLGPHGFDVITRDVIIAVSPFIIFGLAFVGFIAGSQFEWRFIKRFSKRMYIAAIGIDLLTFVVVLASFYFLFTWLNLLEEGVYHPVFIIAISAMGAAPASIMMVLRKFKRFHKLPHLLQFISGFGDLIVIIFFGILLSFEDLSTHQIQLGYIAGFHWFFISILIGFALGIAFYSALTIRRQSQNEYLALLIGLLAFSGGIASYLHLSPIFVSAIAGISYINLPKVRGVASAPFVLAKVERPFYFILLILVGALWNPTPWWAFLLALVYCLVRIGGKTLGGNLVHLFFPEKQAPPKWFGIGLTAQGGVAIAVIINYQIGYTSEPIQTSVTIMLTGLILNELISPSLLTYLCKRNSESP
ncbi:MAG: hypothetical protein B6244_01085 [Candidatus Cloacimonetes bacterium 4572_55]|nr:MAG: hypothetical protein B6244_01085 [Candidatus Cloacimonetes bacterium 4572_55]